MLVGLPGSGKSTTARQLEGDGYFVVSTDAIRIAINRGVSPRGAAGQYRLLETIVWELAQLAARRLLEAGQKTAIDATNLTPKARSMWRDFVREAFPEARFEIHWCLGDRESAERWNPERGHAHAENQEIQSSLEAFFQKLTEDKADAIIVHESRPDLKSRFPESSR